MRWRPGHLAVLLCLATAGAVSALWARNFSRMYYVEFLHHGQRWEVVSEGGRLRVDNFPQVNFEKQDVARQERIVAVLARVYMGTMIDAQGNPDSRAFEIARATNGMDAGKAYSNSKRELARLKRLAVTKRASRSLHLGVLLIAALVFPFVRAGVWVRGRRRVRQGLCVACGYDLRATKDRCPECGRAITSPSTTISSPEMAAPVLSPRRA